MSVKDSNNEWNLATYNGDFNISDGVAERLTIDSSGNATFAGNVTALTIASTNGTGRYFMIQNASGNQTYPVYSFKTDGNTGMMNPSDDTLSLVTGGTTRLTINNSSSTFAGDVSLPDSKKAYFGTSNDLEIYHDGSNSYIKDAGTGNLEIRSNFLKVKSPTAEDMIWAQENAGVTLFHNNVSKLATTSIGVIVSGSIEAVGGSIFVYDGNEFRAGDAGDLRIGHDATNSYLKNNTGDLYINQAAVTKSIIFKVSNANALDTTAITIDSSGNTTFAGDVFEIGNNTSNVDLYLAGGTDSNNTLNFGDPSDNNVGRIIYRHASNQMGLYTDNTQQLLIDSSGNVGIGTDSPDTKLTINSGTANVAMNVVSTDASASIAFADNTTTAYNYNQIGAIGNDLKFVTSTTERMRIDSSGNVGIGTDSPDAKLEVVGAISTGNGASVRSEISSPVGSGNASLLFASNAGNVNTNIAEFIFTNSLNGSSTRNELMRITSGGNVGIGTDSPSTKFQLNSPNAGSIVGGTIGATIYGYSNNEMLVISSTYDQSTGGIRFKRGQAGSEIDSGSITFTTSGTSFNTSSDYRLKEDLQDFAGLDMVSKIPVYDFKWKVDESRSYGVMAHELQEVLPNAVSGEKDAEKHQQVDYSKIVPLLVKSIQEQQVMLKELKAEVDKLKQECKCKN